MKKLLAFGGFAPESLTKSSASGLRWGLCPQTPSSPSTDNFWIGHQIQSHFQINAGYDVYMIKYTLVSNWSNINVTVNVTDLSATELRRLHHESHLQLSPELFRLHMWAIFLEHLTTNEQSAFINDIVKFIQCV